MYIPCCLASGWSARRLPCMVQVPSDEEGGPHDGQADDSADTSPGEADPGQCRPERGTGVECPGRRGDASSGVPDAPARADLGRQGQGGVSQEVAAEDGDTALVRAVEMVVASQGRSWSGALPSPTDFYHYLPEDRERMMSWNDAGTCDESRRQDRLVDATIEQTRRNSRFLRWFTAASLASAMACFFVLHDVGAGVAVLSFPVATTLASAIPDLTQTLTSRRQQDRKDEDD